MNYLTATDWIALAVVVIGGINIGLMGAVQMDMVSLAFGTMTMTTRIIYGLIGVAALYAIYTVMTKTA